MFERNEEDWERQPFIVGSAEDTLQVKLPKYPALSTSAKDTLQVKLLKYPELSV